MSELDPYYGTIDSRKLDDDLEAVIVPLTFARARICLRKISEPMFFDDTW